MITLVVPWLGRRGLVSRGSGRQWRQKRTFSSCPQPLLWLAAAGSVAFWVWHMQRRAGRREPGTMDFSAFGTALTPSTSEREALATATGDAPATERSPSSRAPSGKLPFPLHAAARVANGTAHGAPARRVAELPERSLSWVYRAKQALRLGGPDELRRLALEMAHAGLEAEAGLLENYALLLERSAASRPRVLAAVVRMLEAAAIERRASPALARRRPIVPMPVVAVESRRRATG